MIARLSLRHAMAAIIALVAIAIVKPAAAQAAAAKPSPSAILIAKQIVQLKGVKEHDGPLVRGVVEKVKDVVMQTNFMWQKDINEVTVQMHKEFDSRSSEFVDAPRAPMPATSPRRS